MNDIGVIEAADDMNNGIHLTDVGKELVSQTFSLGSAFDQAGNVHKFDDGRSGFFGMIEVRQKLQTGVGNGHDSHIGVDGAERIVGGFRTGFC